jgi:hypothetical protein
MPRGGARPGSGRKPKSEDSAKLVDFTPEEIQELLNSRYIHSVSRRSVTYTVGFKELFWQRYCDGAEPTQIFQDAGISVHILGKERVYTFLKALKNLKERGQPFNDGAESHMNQPDSTLFIPKPQGRRKNVPPALSAEDVYKMYHKVAYMSQELEFIKKIILAGNEGKRK